MNARIATVELRPKRGGMRAHSGTGRMLVATCAALALNGLACSDEEPDEKSGGASASGANAGNTSTSGGDPASGTAQTPGRMTAGDVGPGELNAPDASRTWPSCGEAFDDEDGGVSPYEDGCAIDERFGVFASPTVAADA